MSGSGPRVAENWDDDFDFQPVSESHTNITSTPAKDASLSHRTVSSDTYGWAQPGPSTPPKRIGADTENWDVDFQDSTNSPSHMRTPPKSRRRRATENWDDDFEDRQTSPSKKSARWDWSDEEGSEFGIGDREEDRTLTSRFRRGAFPSVLLHESPPPPVPPIPSSFVDSRLDPQPFPRSPAASVFSVPVSGHGSVAGHSYSSTTHLALRPTLSTSSFGALPPSPPTHHARERRRLRKKSRPPRVDANIYELEDQSDPPPVTPERSKSPPHDSPPDATPSSAGKSSLVSRIGSVGKKWGAARKKRASMGPVDLALDEQREPQVTTSRPASMAVPSSPPASRWFFRAGGGPGAGTGSPPSNASTLPLKHEKSVDKFLAMVGLDQHETPSKRKQKIRQALPKDLTDMASKRESLAPEPSVVAGTPRTLRRPHGSRHASHSSRRTISSRGSSVPCSASASVDDVSSRRVSYAPSSQDDDMRTPRKSRSSLDPESGSRSFMGGMRRISLTKRHRRSKTTVHEKDKSPEGPSRPSTSTAATAVPRLSEHTASDNGLDITPRPPLRIAPRLSIDDKSLLPPIELRPPSPSPSREMSKSTSEPVVRDSRLDTALESALSSVPSSHSGTVKVFDSSSPPASSTLSKLSVSPQSASLGRATQPPKGKEVDIPIARRNSLGDLKIPTRISQAQVGLRRDLGMVRDFAYSVEHLRELQTTYHGLVVNFQAMLVEVAPVEETQPRVMPPTLFGLPLPGYRARSNTNPQASSQASKRTAEHRELAAAYHSLESKYRIAWECAELLVELGGGAPVQPPSSSSSALHTERSHTPVADGRRSRERAITLAGDETKPQVPFVVAAGSASNPSQWRASTGRHDLSHRQLLLLRDMLSSPDLSAIVTLDSHPEDVNRDWRWGDAMSSTVTLPSEYSSQHDTAAHGSATGPRRKSGRLGMRALRDMLRSLKKSHAGKHGGHHSPTVPPIPTSASSVSMGTMSSLNLPKSPDPSAAQRPPAKTSTGPESVTSLREHPNSPYTTPASVTHRSSPRRPSLASLFKLGQKSRSSTAKSSPSSGPGRELSRDDLHASSASPYPPSAPEEDWDKIESASDLEAVEASGLATVRRKKHRSMYVSAQEAAQVSRGNLNASQLSLPFADPPPTLSQARAQVLASDLERSGSHTRSTKLSDVKELAELDGMSARLIKKTTSKSKRQSYAGPSTKRPTSRNGKTAQGTGSLRSPPPAWQGPVETPDSKQILLPGGGGISLAMTPENIRPLLENARDVYVRCSECIVEMKSLLAAHSELG